VFAAFCIDMILTIKRFCGEQIFCAPVSRINISYIMHRAIDTSVSIIGTWLFHILMCAPDLFYRQNGDAPLNIADSVLSTLDPQTFR